MCIVPCQSEVLAHVHKFATVIGFRTAKELIVGTQGFHLACVQGRPQAPLARVSTSWHFLTRVSSSVPPLWPEAHPEPDEKLCFSLFKLLLVSPIQALHLVCVGG